MASSLLNSRKTSVTDAGTGPVPSTGALPVLGFRARLLGTLATWALLLLAIPGVGRLDGYGHIAMVALAPWALVASCPTGGRWLRCYLAEVLGSMIGLAGVCYWMAYVLPAGVLFSFPDSFFMGAAGVLLRLAARRFPLSLAVPVVWIAAEILRFVLPAPLAFGWHRLGTYAHHTEWLLGSARVWGAWGLGLVFGALGGGLADWWRARAGVAPAGGIVLSRICALVPLGLAILLVLASSPPESVDGPRVLLVQPGIEQERKRFGDRFLDQYVPAVSLTRESLREAAELGEPVPDLVLWGETMLPAGSAEDSVVQAAREGLLPAPWTGLEVDAGLLADQELFLQAVTSGVLFGDPRLSALVGSRLSSAQVPWEAEVAAGHPIIPEGSSFLAGAEEWRADHGRIARSNVLYVWSADARRSAPMRKRNLVPFGETLSGLQWVPWVRETMRRVGGYVPDFLAGEATGIVGVTLRDGREVRVAGAVCFDNAYDFPFTQAARSGRVDLFVIGSNEAWYRDSTAMPQMLAFSRVIAAETGRSVVRATNSGISSVIGPSGGVLDHIEVDGEPEMVAGTLRATVPVPASGSARATFFVRTETWQKAAWLALALLLSALGWLSEDRRGAVGNRAPVEG